MPATRRRPVLLASAVVLAAGALAGCTGSHPVSQITTTALVCRDSPGQQGRDTPPARVVDGVEGFIGDPDPAQPLLDWGRIGGRNYLAWKTGFAVSPGARPYRTLRVVSPASALLAYGLGTYRPARVLRLPACGARWTLYVGAILVTGPACVTIAVIAPSGPAAQVTVPVLRTRC
jgi:hypothetical protein